MRLGVAAAAAGAVVRRRSGVVAAAAGAVVRRCRLLAGCACSRVCSRLDQYWRCPQPRVACCGRLPTDTALLPCGGASHMFASC